MPVCDFMEDGLVNGRFVINLFDGKMFVVSRPIESGETTEFAERARVSANVPGMLASGELELVNAADLPGVLFPDGAQGFLLPIPAVGTDGGMREGMARLFGVGRPGKAKRRR